MNHGLADCQGHLPPAAGWFNRARRQGGKKLLAVGEGAQVDSFDRGNEAEAQA
ncbi:MAG TPA: hypothetical protein VF355_09015 [Anaerolineaceae bacterium]